MTHSSDAEPGSPQPVADYALGDLTLRVNTVQVLRGDREIPLPRLSFDLLLALVRAAPNLVTIDELMNRVWPGLVVSPETVSQRVKLLRAALDDTPRNPRYIAGVRGRGYRIVAAVAPMDRTAAAAAPSLPQHPQGLKRSRSHILWGGALVLCIAILSAAWWMRTTKDTPAGTLPDKTVAVLPFENLGGSPQDAVLAFGVAETLLHRLAGFKDLVVIARRSSFSFDSGKEDIRDIGRKLNARYVVEGSLQSDRTRLRITAQLIDAVDGSHVWSMQFDRKPEDIFTIQDEIASKVAQAMQLTVGARRNVSATRNFDAYLAYAQGRARLASGRVADARLALTDLERAIRIDPQFVDAYVSLARAHSQVAENEVTEERGTNVKKANAAARQLLEQALQLDPNNAEAHFELGVLLDDTSQAEAQFRRGLELNPNSAVGYARLTQVLWWRGERNQALASIERARQLDPLDLDYDNMKATILLYGRSDVQQAEELSLKVLERDPSSSTALMRLGEVYWCCRAQFARGARYLEQSLQSDPGNEFGLRMLMRAYLDMGEPAEAEAIAAAAPHPVAARLVAVLLYRRQWQAAGEQTYQASRRATREPLDDHIAALAVRMHAGVTGDYRSARQFLEEHANVTWAADGTPRIDTSYERDYVVALAELLTRTGEQERATRLLQAMLAKFDYESHQLGRGDMWYLRSIPLALTLLGRDADALAALERCVDEGFSHDSWAFLDIEPGYERFRTLPRFQAIAGKARAIAAEQRRQLLQMREERLISSRITAHPP